MAIENIEILQIMNTIDPGVDLCDAYRRGTDTDQKFIANLAQFLGTFLKENSQLVEVFGDKTDDLDLKNAHEMVNYVYMIWQLFGANRRNVPFVFQHSQQYIGNYQIFFQIK